MDERISSVYLIYSVVWLSRSEKRYCQRASRKGNESGNLADLIAIRRSIRPPDFRIHFPFCAPLSTSLFQRKHKLCPHPFCTHDIDRLVVGVDDFLGDRKAEAGSFFVLAS